MGEPATVRVADVLRAALDVLSDEDYARLAARIDAMASIAPTKPPRETPAPEWTGPDRWETITKVLDDEPRPDEGGWEGHVAIGAWEPYASLVYPDWHFGHGVTGPQAITTWRRPLRRVSP